MQESDFTIQQEAHPPLEVFACQKCGSSRISIKNYGQKVMGTVGVIAGAAAGVTSAMSGAEAGGVVGAVAGPVGAVVGGVFGAILGGMIGGGVGGMAGAKLGMVVDEIILDNYVCLACTHTFSLARD